jgi:DNA polymerase-3 subunit beta
MKFEGQVLDISVNVRYMQEVLQRMDNEEVRLEMSGPLKPIIIRGADEETYQYLLMPVQSR